MQFALQNAEQLLHTPPEESFRLWVGVENMPCVTVGDDDCVTRTGEQCASKIVGIAQFALDDDELRLQQRQADQAGDGLRKQSLHRGPRRVRTDALDTEDPLQIPKMCIRDSPCG